MEADRNSWKKPESSPKLTPKPIATESPKPTPKTESSPKPTLKTSSDAPKPVPLTKTTSFEFAKTAPKPIQLRSISPQEEVSKSPRPVKKVTIDKNSPNTPSPRPQHKKNVSSSEQIRKTLRRLEQLENSKKKSDLWEKKLIEEKLQEEKNLSQFKELEKSRRQKELGGLITERKSIFLDARQELVSSAIEQKMEDLKQYILEEDTHFRQKQSNAPEVKIDENNNPFKVFSSKVKYDMIQGEEPEEFSSDIQHIKDKLILEKKENEKK